MATRFYPDPTNVPSVSPGYDDLWTDTTAAVRRKLTIDTPGDNASTSFEVSETSASIVHKLAVQFVSEPLDSISATLAAFKFQFRCVENDAKSDAKIISCIRKCDSDGSNDVDIQSQLASLTEFDDAVLTNRGRTSYNANDQALSQGDRLIFEIGVYFSNTKTASYSGTVNVTDNHATTDLPENDTETTAYNSWIETGDTFTVASGDPPAEVVKLGPMFAFA